MSLHDEARSLPAVDKDHPTRTVGAVRHALKVVPFFAKQGLVLPADGAPLEEILRPLPLLTRDKIRPTLPKVWVPDGRDVKAELASGKLSVVETGLGEGRVRVLFDRMAWRAQERRALQIHPRAARVLEGDGRVRDAVLWIPERGTGSCGAGDPEYEDRLEGDRLHLNPRQDPSFWTDTVLTRMLDELTRHETMGLLADPFYLDPLARHATALGRRLDVRAFVALTRGLTTAAHRKAIARAYAGPVFQVFGARETGILFVEGDDGLLHHAPFTTHVEFLRPRVETPGATNVGLVVVTTLERDVQPLVRYVLGDLVQIADAPSRFTTVSPIASVEGRLEDAVARPDGAIVTPAAIDRALAPLDLPGYQLTQREPSSVEIEVVGGNAAAVTAALAPLLVAMNITVRVATALAIDPNGKYRTCRRLVPLTTPAFEGVS